MKLLTFIKSLTKKVEFKTPSLVDNVHNKLLKSATLTLLSAGIVVTGLAPAVEISNSKYNSTKVELNFENGIKPANAGFFEDYFKGKVVDECLFNNCIGKGINGYMNYYNWVRKNEEEQSFSQQNIKSPRRISYEKKTGNCPTKQEWLRIVSNNQE